jgi:hypothetical protein
VQATLNSREWINRFRTRYVMTYTVRNARSEPATVIVRQRGLGRSTKVVEASLKRSRTDARVLQWDVPVPANGETELKFTLETGW